MATTTTSVTMPSLLDLLPPQAQTPQGGKGASAFDALLQPSPSRATADGTRPATSHEPPRRSDHDATPPPHAPTRQRPRQDEPEQHLDDADDLAPITDVTDQPTDDVSFDDQTSVAEEDVVAESLAGMTVCVLPVPQPEDTPNEATTAATIEPAAGKRGHRTRSSGSVPTGEVHGASRGEFTPPVEATTPLHEEKQAAETEATHETGEMGEKSAQQQTVVSDGSKVAAEAGDGGTARASQPAVVASLATATEPNAETRDSEPSAPQSDSSMAESVQGPETTRTVAFFPTGSEIPLVGPVVAPQPAATAESNPSQTSPTATTGVSPAGAGRRSRLPAEMLTPDAGRATRSSATNIDATRLLSRVARAFAAAQQRDGEIQLRLSPPELGSLKLTIQMQDGGLIAKLETETSSAKTALIDNLPALRERLAEQGVRIERFDVDLMQRQPGGMPDRPGDQQREAPPAPRAEPATRSRTESSPSPHGLLAATSSATELNVIV